VLGQLKFKAVMKHQVQLLTIIEATNALLWLGEPRGFYFMRKV